MNDRQNISNLLIGMIMGGMFALLYAPYSGEKTRGKLKQLAQDKMDDVKDTLEDRKQELGEELHNIQDKIKGEMGNGERSLVRKARNTGS